MYFPLIVYIQVSIIFIHTILSRHVDLYVRTLLLMLMRVSRCVVAKAVVERMDTCRNPRQHSQTNGVIIKANVCLYLFIIIILQMASIFQLRAVATAMRVVLDLVRQNNLPFLTVYAHTFACPN